MKKLTILMLLVLVAGMQVAYGLSFGDSQMAGVQSGSGGTLRDNIIPALALADVSPLALRLTAVQPEGQSLADSQLLKKGMWKDPDTGLTWMVCTLGEDWDGNSCNVDYTHQDRFHTGNWWDAAIAVSKLSYGGFDDWRLPTIGELAGLRKTCPALDPASHSDHNLLSQFVPRYGDIATAHGTEKILLNCPSIRDTSPTVPGYLRMDGAVWSSSKNVDFDKSQQFWVLGGPRQQANPVYLEPHGLADDTNAVLAVRGGSYDEFRDTLILANAATAKTNRQGQVDAIQKQKDLQQYEGHDAAIRQSQADKYAEHQKVVVAFRKSVKVGDATVVYVRQNPYNGLVIAIDGNIVKVQIADLGQTISFSRNKIYPVP